MRVAVRTSCRYPRLWMSGQLLMSWVISSLPSPEAHPTDHTGMSASLCPPSVTGQRARRAAPPAATGQPVLPCRHCGAPHLNARRRPPRRLMSHSLPVAAAAVTASPTVVTVPLGDRSYPIYIGRGLLQDGDLLRRHIVGKSCLVVTNDTVAPLYLQRCVHTAALGGEVIDHKQAGVLTNVLFASSPWRQSCGRPCCGWADPCRDCRPP